MTNKIEKHKTTTKAHSFKRKENTDNVFRNVEIGMPALSGALGDG